jgi:hypothetical protein
LTWGALVLGVVGTTWPRLDEGNVGPSERLIGHADHALGW